MQRLAGGGQLHGVGLCRDGALRRSGGADLQGAVQLDGYIRHRRDGSGERPVRADAGTGHRRGEVFQKLKSP